MLNCPSSSFRSLDQLDYDMESSNNNSVDNDDPINVPPNTERTLPSLPASRTSSNSSAITSHTTNNSTTFDTQRRFPRVFESSQSASDIFSYQRTPRQLPYNSVCGRYQAKKDAFKNQSKIKMSSFTASNID